MASTGTSVRDDKNSNDDDKDVLAENGATHIKYFVAEPGTQQRFAAKSRLFNLVEDEGASRTASSAFWPLACGPLDPFMTVCHSVPPVTALDTEYR